MSQTHSKSRSAKRGATSKKSFLSILKQKRLTRERFLFLPKDEREEYLRLLTPEQILELKYDWGFFGRDKQQPPDGDWLTWLIKAGRGWDNYYSPFRCTAGKYSPRARRSHHRPFAFSSRLA